MKTSRSLSVLALSSLLLGSASGGEPKPGSFLDWAPRPPMGWNSWDCFGCTVTEQLVKTNADYMANQLARHGREYIVVDIQL